MSRNSKVGISLAGAVVALSLSACGSDGGEDFADQSVKEIMRQSEKDMKTLRSMTFQATIDQDGQKLDLELSSDRDGNCTGTIGFDGVTGDLLRVDGADYLRGDEEFWAKTSGESAQAVVAMLGDRWAKLPSSDDFSSFCDLDEFFKSMDEDSGDEDATKGNVATVAGQEAVEVLTEEDGGTVHAWVATEGKHYILKFEQVGGDGPGSATFSDFDEPVDAKAPAKDEYVDLAALGG